MGLDTVELVLEVEEQFGVPIPDNDAEQIQTMGQLSDYLYVRLAEIRRTPCRTAGTFYSIRRLVREELSLPKEAIRPASDVESLVPGGKRRRMWRRFNALAARRLPPLKWPAWFAIGFGICWVCGLMLAIGLPVVLPILAYTTPLTLLVWAVVFATLWLLFLPLARVVPAEVATFGKLARTLTPFATLPADLDDTAEQAWIWETLCEIVVQQLAVDRAELHRDAHFVNDLGCD
jgi:acyl carrier protein